MAPEPRQSIADQIEAALNEGAVWSPEQPGLNAWPAPSVRREFAEWLAARISITPDRDEPGGAS